MKPLWLGLAAVVVVTFGLGVWVWQGQADPVSPDARMNAEQQRELAQEIGYLK